MKSAIATLSFGNFLIGTGAFVVAGLTSHIARDFDVTIAAAAQLLTIYTLTYALSSPFLTTLASGSARRLALATAMTLFSAGNLVVAVADSFGVLCAGRVMAGLGAALFSPLAYALAADLSLPEKRARVLSLVILGLTVANVVGVPLGAAVGATDGWRWTFIAVGGLGLATSLAMLVLLPGTEPGPPRSLAAIGQALSRGVVVATIAVSFLHYAALFVVFAYLAPIVAAGRAFGPLGVPWLLFLFGCGSIAGNLIGGWAADRWDKTRVITVSLVLLVPILALFPPACGSATAAGVLALAWGAVGLAFMAPQQHRLISLPGQAAPVLLSLNVSAIYLGGAAGAVIGAAVEHLGVSAFGFAGATLAATALLLSATIAPSPDDSRDRLRPGRGAAAEPSA